MDFDMLTHLRDGKHTGLAKLMLIEIELFATQDTHRSFPSIARLAHDLGVKPRRAQQILRKLIAEGAVRVVGKGGRGLANCYQLCDLPETLHPSAPFSDNGAIETPKGCNFEQEKGATQCTPSSTEKERKERDGLLSQKGEEAEETRQLCVRGEVCGIVHQPGCCDVDPWAMAS
jgi:Helix-turn-helix domain